MSDDRPAVSGGVVRPDCTCETGCLFSGEKPQPSPAAEAFGVSALPVPAAAAARHDMSGGGAEGVIAVWRLVMLGMALGLGLVMSSFWLWRRLPLPFYGYGQLIPAGLGLLAVLLPGPSSAGWQRLRCASLAVAGLAPFLTWQLRSDGNFYFGVCVLLLLAAVIWHWLETLLVVRRAAVAGGHEKLARAVSRSMSMIVYGVVIPLCAGHGAFLLLVLTAGGGTAFDFGLIWNTQPKIIGDVLRILVFWGGCHVGVNCLAAAVLSSRSGAGTSSGVVAVGPADGAGDI